jgi:hypothetical protein
MALGTCSAAVCGLSYLSLFLVDDLLFQVEDGLEVNKFSAEAAGGAWHNMVYRLCVIRCLAWPPSCPLQSISVLVSCRHCSCCRSAATAVVLGGSCIVCTARLAGYVVSSSPELIQ